MRASHTTEPSMLSVYLRRGARPCGAATAAVCPTTFDERLDQRARAVAEDGVQLFGELVREVVGGDRRRAALALGDAEHPARDVEDGTFPRAVVVAQQRRVILDAAVLFVGAVDD